MSEFGLRAARAPDVEAVRALQLRWQGEQATFGFVAGSRDEIAAYLGDYFVVAEADGELVGYAYGALRPCGDEAIWSAEDREHLELDDIYVVPERRSSGLGSAMFRWLDERARRAGIERVKVYTATRDTAKVVAFYERLGLRPWCVVMFR